MYRSRMIYSKALRETKCKENKLYKLEQTGYRNELDLQIKDYGWSWKVK